MTNSFEHTRRAVYRVVYPVCERPSLRLGPESFSILDCSELGLRYQCPDAHLPPLGSTISGVVHFRRGTQVEITGEVVRVEHGTVALWFRSQAIPLSEVMHERRYLETSDDALQERKS